MKDASPDFASETAVTLTANPGITTQVVVDTMDAVRGGDGGLLFTDIMFGIAN